MRALIRRLLPVLAVLLLVIGCSKPAPTVPVPPAGEAPAPPAQQPEQPAVSGPQAKSLLPAADLTLDFTVWDLGATQPEKVTEHLIREKERTVVIYGGKPYFTWLTDDSGVWRNDPWGGGALLRYLPPVLQSGLVWKQESGGKTIWFQLTENEHAPCPIGSGYGMSDDKCWTLRVLGPGELLTYRWAEGYGPTYVWTVNAASPSAAFRKNVETNRPGALTPSERAAFLSQAPPTGGPKVKVAPATAQEFDAARVKQLGLKTLQADLDGDGKAEQLRGLLGAYSMLPVELLDASGQRLGEVGSYGAEPTRLDVVRFDGSSRAFLQQQVHELGGYDFGTIGPVVKSEDGTWHFEPPYGWDLKSTGTAASRMTASPDGVVTVEWDMGDPAKHTRVRQYRFQPETADKRPLVRMESETYRPEGSALVYPTDPQQVLQAAFVAKWFKQLGPEIPRYFATAAAANAFLADDRIDSPNYGPGTTEFATITKESPQCFHQTAAVKLGPNNTAPFMASWGGYEWGAQAWGTVTFTKAADGRTMIEKLVIEDSCFGGG